MTRDELALNHEEAFELLAYLVMSARTGLAHPPAYQLFRLVSAAQKLAETWSRRCPEEHRPYLDAFLSATAAEAPKFQSDPAAFAAFLEESSRALAAHTRTLDWGA